MKRIKIILCLFVNLLVIMSCNAGYEDEEQGQLDSLAAESQKKITRLYEKGDSIEKVNIARPDTIELH